jgi:hypothetical protein
MSRFSKMAAGLSLLSVIAIAGCPLTNNPDGDNDPNTPTTVVGAWKGVLTGASTKTVEGVAGVPLPGTRSLTIKFGNDFAPTSVPIWGFDRAFDQSTQKNQVGQSQTFEYAANQPARDITLIATIGEVSYAKDKVTVAMDLDYSSVGEAIGLAEDGTGTMTLAAEIDGAYLSVTGIATYTVTSTANGVTTHTTETLSFKGKLSKKS